MTFIEQLKAHIGGLIRIKTQLYWYKEGKWAEASERVYLLLDALIDDGDGPIVEAATDPDDPVPLRPTDPEPASVLLSIDGAPKWIWAYESSMEFIK